MFSYNDKFHTNFRSSSDAAFMGVRIYGRNNKTWYVKYIIKPLWRVGNIFSKIKWYINYRFVKEHRYHLIDTGLEPGYCDIDHIMLHGMFSLLDRYVDQEHNGAEELEIWGKDLTSRSDGMSAHWDHVQGERELEAVFLYRWWHVTRPADLKKEEELLHNVYGNRPFTFEPVGDGSGNSIMVSRPFTPEEEAAKIEHALLEKKIEDETEEMLHRLINIRKGLWT